MTGEAAAELVTLTRLTLRPTRRLLVFLPLGLILFAAGANVGAGFLLVLAGGLVGCVPWAWFVTRRAANSVQAGRSVPREVVAGESVQVALEVRANTVASVVARDELTGAVGVVDEPREGGRLVGEVRLHRGSVAGGVVAAEVTDPFGLFLARVAGDVPSRVEVLPPLVRLPSFDLARTATRQAQQRPRRGGEGAETEGTREYRRGDPARSVHWRSSARREQLVVRRLVGEASGRLRVVIAPGPWTRDRLDQACAAVVALAEGAERGALAVELAVGPHLVDWHATTGRRLLAHLQPHLGTGDEADGAPDQEAPGLVAAREADGAPPAEVTLQLRADQAGTSLTVTVGGASRPVGTIAPDAPLDDLVAWLGDQLRARAVA